MYDRNRLIRAEPEFAVIKCKYKTTRVVNGVSRFFDAFASTCSPVGGILAVNEYRAIINQRLFTNGNKMSKGLFKCGTLARETFSRDGGGFTHTVLNVPVTSHYVRSLCPRNAKREREGEGGRARTREFSIRAIRPRPDGRLIRRG